MQDVERRILIPIHHQPTVRAGMPTHLDVLGHELATLGIAALLAGIVGVYQQHAASGTCSLGDTILLELAPTSV